MIMLCAEQIVKLEDLDASLVSSGKSEAEAALGRATEEVLRFRMRASFYVLPTLPLHAPTDVAV
jgi:predicted DNA repair protein MutK